MAQSTTSKQLESAHPLAADSPVHMAEADYEQARPSTPAECLSTVRHLTTDVMSAHTAISDYLKPPAEVAVADKHTYEGLAGQYVVRTDTLLQLCSPDPVGLHLAYLHLGDYSRASSSMHSVDNRGLARLVAAGKDPKLARDLLDRLRIASEKLGNQRAAIIDYFRNSTSQPNQDASASTELAQIMASVAETAANVKLACTQIDQLWGDMRWIKVTLSGPTGRLVPAPDDEPEVVRQASAPQQTPASQMDTDRPPRQTPNSPARHGLFDEGVWLAQLPEFDRSTAANILRSPRRLPDFDPPPSWGRALIRCRVIARSSAQYRMVNEGRLKRLETLLFHMAPRLERGMPRTVARSAGVQGAYA